MAEQIILDIQIDKTQAEKNVSSVTDKIFLLTEANKKLKQSVKDESGETKKSTEQKKKLNQEIQKNNDELKDLRKERNEGIKTIKTEISSLDALRKRNVSLKKDRDKLNLSTKDGQKQFKALNKEIKNNNDVLKKAEQAGGDYQRSVGDYGSALSGVSPVLGGAVSGIQAMIKASLAFIATPIGAVIAALALGLGALVKFFKSSEEGQNKLNKIMAVASVIMGNLSDIASNVGEAIFNAFSAPGKTIKALGKFIQDNIINRFKAIGILGKSIVKILSGDIKQGFKDLGNASLQLTTGVEDLTGKLEKGFNKASEAAKELVKETKNEIAAAAALADQEAKADKIERKLLIDRAKIESQIAELRLQSKKEDETSAKDRLEFLEEANKLTQDLASRELQAAKIRADIKTQQNTFSKSTKEDLNEEAELIAKVSQIEVAAANQQRNLERERQKFLKQTAKEEEELAESAKETAIETAEFNKELAQQALESEQERVAIIEEIETLTQERRLVQLEELANIEEEKRIADLEKLISAADKRKDVAEEIKQLEEITQNRRKQQGEELSGFSSQKSIEEIDRAISEAETKKSISEKRFDETIKLQEDLKNGVISIEEAKGEEIEAIENETDERRKNALEELQRRETEKMLNEIQDVNELAEAKREIAEKEFQDILTEQEQLKEQLSNIRDDEQREQLESRILLDEELELAAQDHADRITEIDAEEKEKLKEQNLQRKETVQEILGELLVSDQQFQDSRLAAGLSATQGLIEASKAEGTGAEKAAAVAAAAVQGLTTIVKAEQEQRLKELDEFLEKDVAKKTTAAEETRKTSVANAETTAEIRIKEAKRAFNDAIANGADAEDAEDELAKAIERINKNKNVAILGFDEQLDADKDAINKQAETKRNEELKKQFETNKKLAIAEAITNGVLAVLKAFTLGPILGPIAAIIIAGLTAVQVNKIKNQKAPTFAKGGELPLGGVTLGGKSHAMGGTKLYDGSGSLVAEAEANESMFVLNKNATAAISGLSNINESFGGKAFGQGAKFLQEGGLIDTAPTEAQTDDFAEALQEAPIFVRVTDINDGQGVAAEVEANGEV